MSLDQDGYFLEKNFLNQNTVNKILKNVDSIFNGNQYIPNSYTLIQKKNKKYKLNITLPLISVLDPNLLEISLDIMSCIKKNFKNNIYDLENYTLTNIEIEESRQENLFWHTDNRRGMFRCFLFLRGGSKNSGALRYMKSSQLRKYHVEHKLNDDQIKENKDKIEDIFCEPGDLVIVDTYGFHANYNQKQKRTVIMFEFQNNGSTEPKSDIFFSSQLITDRVLKNINFFKPKIGNVLHGTSQRINQPHYHLRFKGLTKPVFRYLINKFF